MCAQHSAWGDRFVLTNSGVAIDCHNGTFNCTAEPSAMRSTDSSSGHFFDVSPGSYQVG